MLPLVAAAGRRAAGMRAFQARCEAWVRDAIRADLEVERLVQRVRMGLERREIPFVWWKGACFRDVLYPQPWLRAMRDVDLLLLDRDLDRAVAALESLGFRARRGYPSRPFSMRFSTERQLDAPRGGMVELHAGPTYERAGSRVDLDGLLTRRLGTPRGPIPAWEDHLLLLAIHHARTGMLAGIRHLLDMARLVTVCPLDWGTVQQRARGWGCQTALSVCLEAVRSWFGLELPVRLEPMEPKGFRGVLIRSLALRGAGGPGGGRLRIVPLSTSAPGWVHDLWRPFLYGLLLDQRSSRCAFFAHVLATRAIDLGALAWRGVRFRQHAGFDGSGPSDGVDPSFMSGRGFRGSATARTTRTGTGPGSASRASRTRARRPS